MQLTQFKMADKIINLSKHNLTDIELRTAVIVADAYSSTENKRALGKLPE